MKVKKHSKLLSLLLAFAVLLSMMPRDFSAAAEELTIKMRPESQLMKPRTDKNPINMVEGEGINVGAMVTDSTGFEVTEEDPDFGDDIIVYQNLKWESDDPEGLKVDGQGTHVALKAEKKGDYTVTVTYPPVFGKTFKELEIKVNVKEGTPPEEPVVKVVAVDPPEKINIGDTAEISFKGYDQFDNEKPVNIKLLSVSPGNFLEASVVDNKLQVKGLKEGKNFIRVGSEDNASAAEAGFWIEVVDPDPTIFDVDDATNTLKGFKGGKTFNNPTELDIPAQVKGVDIKHIGKDAFKFSTMSSVTKIKNRITKLTLPEGLEDTASMAFQGNDIKEITIPSTMTKIGERMLFGNENLTNVNFAVTENLKTIDKGAFYNTALETVTIPKGVTLIGAETFKGTNMKSIDIPDTVTEIGKQAFALAMFEEFTLPENVTTAGDELFFRNFAEKTGQNGGTLRFTKVFDSKKILTPFKANGIVNPQPVTVKYENEADASIKDPEVVTGFEKYIVKKKSGEYKFETAAGDKHFYKDYMNPFEGSLSTHAYDKDIADKILGENYYREDETYEFNAPDIEGYTTPAVITKKITKGDHEVVFKYQPLPDCNITVKGEGISVSPGTENLKASTQVSLVVHEPVNKKLDKLIVDGKDVKADAEYNGIDYLYSFKIMKDTEIEAVYEDEEVENKFVFKADKNNLSIGEKAVYTLEYRGKALTLPHDEINLSSTDDEMFRFDHDKKLIIPRKAGKGTLTASLKNHPEIKADVKFDIKPIKVNISLQGDKKTIFHRTEVTIDKLYLKGDVDYYKDLELNEASPLIALSELLRSNGLNPGDKTVLDCSDDGTWMKVIANDKFEPGEINEYGSFMFTHNGKLAGNGIGQEPLNEDDSVVVYYDPDYRDASKVANFEKTFYEIKEGEEAEFILHGYKDRWVQEGTEWVHYVDFDGPLEGAKLEITDPEGKITLTEDKTDAEGKIKYKFNKKGEYFVSAVQEGAGHAAFSRPAAKVAVKEAASPPSPGPTPNPTPQPQPNPTPQPDDKDDPIKLEEKKGSKLSIGKEVEKKLAEGKIEYLELIVKEASIKLSPENFKSVYAEGKGNSYFKVRILNKNKAGLSKKAEKIVKGKKIYALKLVVSGKSIKRLKEKTEISLPYKAPKKSKKAGFYAVDLSNRNKLIKAKYDKASKKLVFMSKNIGKYGITTKIKAKKK